MDICFAILIDIICSLALYEKTAQSGFDKKFIVPRSGLMST